MSSTLFDLGFTSSQSTQSPDPATNKNRVVQPVLPLTVKQISDAYNAAAGKSNLVIDGVEATTNVKLLGMVMNKEEKKTNATFILDDGTGRIDVIRWMNDASDTAEMAAVQNGIYVTVIGSLKDLQGKKQFGAFSIRPVIDYDAIHHHYIQCIHVHLVNTGAKVGASTQQQISPANSVPLFGGVKREQTPAPSQISTHTSNGGSETDIYKMVLNFFQEPGSLAVENGVHVDEVVKRLGLPEKKIKEAIDYHVDAGLLYSTIDDCHFKAT